jgi:signal transduction histidine kinase
MSASEQVLVDLIHDLAQPLSAIETGVYCLDLHIDPQNARAQEYLRTIQQQLERAHNMLAAAAAEVRQARGENYQMAGASR